MNKLLTNWLGHSITNILTLLLIAATTSHAEGTMPVEGFANCYEQAGPDGCQIAWNLRGKPSVSYYRVQRFNAEENEWVNIGRPHSDPEWVTDKKIRDGGLYRVAACDDLAGEFDCGHSTVLWIPYMPKNDELPSQVVVTLPHNGQQEVMDVTIDEEIYNISKLGQAQFNIYTMINVANALREDLPEMSEPVHPPPHTDTIEHRIRDSVFREYSNIRQALLTARAE